MTIVSKVIYGMLKSIKQPYAYLEIELKKPLITNPTADSVLI